MRKAQSPTDLPAFPDLIRELQDAVVLFDTLRRVQMSYTVPDELYELCQRVVEHRDQPEGSPPRSRGHKSVPSSPDRLSAEQNALRHAPLRQMVFEVIPPGEEFSVSDVTHGLADLGIAANATAVSNALGHWAARGRLRRVRKGVYRSLAGDSAQNTSAVDSFNDTQDLGSTSSPGGMPAPLNKNRKAG